MRAAVLKQVHFPFVLNVLDESANLDVNPKGDLRAASADLPAQ